MVNYNEYGKGDILLINATGTTWNRVLSTSKMWRMWRI